ncbi:MAG: ferric reductase-like transmembrane domain-containing protein [Thiohalocapsa sp.]|nr:ferric reductase-like transmembrane domain-containing protein [Thiohalocapsa sp.]MCF7991514.1 ferric reductase-like transmembrane domain-containing protein [Thiohalocapsa sp.]
MHKQIAVVALLLVLIHPLILLPAGYPWQMLLPGPAVPPAIRLGILAVLATVLLIVLSVWRKGLRIPYEVWQITHGMLAIAVLALAALHILGAGRYSQMLPMRVAVVLYLALLILLFFYFRIARPLRSLWRPWRVVENRAELGRSPSGSARGPRAKPRRMGPIVGQSAPASDRRRKHRPLRSAGECPD